MLRDITTTSAQVNSVPCIRKTYNSFKPSNQKKVQFDADGMISPPSSAMLSVSDGGREKAAEKGARDCHKYPTKTGDSADTSHREWFDMGRRQIRYV
jgi:hypothetical protein